MARDDWRIRIELPEEEHAHGLLGRLRLAERRDGAAARGGARGPPAGRLARRLDHLRLRGLEPEADRPSARWSRPSCGRAARSRRGVARALARRRGPLGRRAAGADMEEERARARLRALGGAGRRAARTARRDELADRLEAEGFGSCAAGTT